MKVTVSGQTYAAAIEESAVPEDEHWPQPTAQRRGWGTTYVYEVEEEGAWLIVTHLEDLIECAHGWDENGGRDLRALRADVARIRASLD